MDPKETELENLQPSPNTETQTVEDSPTNNDAVLQLLRETVQETNARARAEEARRVQLERELEDYRNAKNNPPKKEVTAEEYFANPVEILRSEIQAQLAPLTKFAAETKKNQAYFELKNRFLADARYGPLVTKLGQYLDNIMSNLEPTEQNMFNAIHNLIGQLAVTNPEALVDKPKEDTPPKETTPPKNNMQPPHLRPSSSPRPSQERDKPKKQYTENEKRLMREANMTEEQWENFLNAPASLKGIKK